MKSSCSPLLSPLFRREAFLFSKFSSTTPIKVSAGMKSIFVCSLILFGARRTLSRALVTDYCDPSSQRKRKRQEKTASFYVQRHVAKLVYAAAAAAAVKPTWMGKLIVPRNRSRWAKLNCIWLFFFFFSQEERSHFYKVKILFVASRPLGKHDVGRNNKNVSCKIYSSVKKWGWLRRR